jgi:hypothetical protein
MTVDEEREHLETQLTTLETELNEAIREGRNEDGLERLREEIFRARAAFNRGCN